MLRPSALSLVLFLTACASNVVQSDVQDTQSPSDAVADSSNDTTTPTDTPAPDDVPNGTDAATDVATDATSTDGANPDTLRVLFIGNSYTYVNDLPSMIRNIAASSGRTPAIEVDSVTVGGATLANHYTTGNATMRIATGGFRYVVLQGQSVEPLLQGTNFLTYAAQFSAASRAVSATPVFFATWARIAGDPVYSEFWSGGAPQAMTDRLNMAYATAAMEGGGRLASVGRAWMRAITMRPALRLHDPDGSHPNIAGSYLAACVFYEVLTGNAVPASAMIPIGVTPDDATFLRTIAHDVATGM